jgi:hypothetical protein
VTAGQSLRRPAAKPRSSRTVLTWPGRPSRKVAAGAVQEHAGELADQGAGGGEFRASAGDGVQGGAVAVGEVAGRGEDPGGHFL